MTEQSVLKETFETEEAKVKHLNELVGKIDEAINNAAAFATVHKLSFHINGPAYGMGGYFDAEDEDTNNRGWLASSQSC